MGKRERFGHNGRHGRAFGNRRFYEIMGKRERFGKP